MTTEKRPPGTQQILLTFRQSQGQEYAQSTVELRETCQRPFLPLGLFLWGCTSETWVTRVSVGNYHEATITSGRIPGRYFETGLSLEQVLARASSGELRQSVDARQVIELREATPGTVMCLDIAGPYQAACFWGLTYTFGGPVMNVTLEAHSRRDPEYSHVATEGFRGQIVERRLGGDVVTNEIWAPSEESACRLLQAYARPAGGS